MSNNETLEHGLPVEIGKIDKELGKLWESSGDTKTRASLINLVVYTENEADLAADNEVLATVAGRHPCRAILILGNPTAPTSQARAWISAHCHLLGKEMRQICSEQITFRLDGDAANALPNIVFSHLDSDLPLCLWWKSELPEPLDEKLWAWVDRLIFDSGSWRNPLHQFSIIRHISSTPKSGAVLCDLNWTRLHAWRFALASLFDNASAFPHLAWVESLTLHCAPGSRTAALLLIGWLAGRLKWRLDAEEATFVSASGHVIPFHIAESEGPNLSLIEIKSREARFELKLAEASDFFESTTQTPGIPGIRQILPAPRGRLEDTLLAELSRAGRHALYTESLEIILPLLKH
ncbi:MAG: glucose-6-phosphate dehydrogenase assembly protein OpcA [bacterium]